MNDSNFIVLDCVLEGLFGGKFLITAADKSHVGRISLIGFGVPDTLIECQDKLYTICRADTLLEGRWLLVDKKLGYRHGADGLGYQTHT